MSKMSRAVSVLDAWKGELSDNTDRSFHRDHLRARKDEAFTERNRVVALLARMARELGWRAGIGTHEDKPGEAWDPEWRTIVCIDMPNRQASWHLHDRDAHLLEGLPRYEGTWDGHTTEEKYQRVAALAAAFDILGGKP